MNLLTNLNRRTIELLIEKYKHMFAKDKFEIGRVRSNNAEIKFTSNKYIIIRDHIISDFQ